MPFKRISDSRRRVVLTARVLIYLLLFLAFALLPETKATQQKLPFQEGERLSFDIYWGFLKVGETVMQVLPNTIVNGQAVRHFRLATRTTPLIDLIYKVRSEIEAFTDLGMNRSVLYKKNHREAGIHRNVMVTFDWKKNKAAYVSFGRQEQETDILPGTFDPLGILFYSRTQNYSATDRFERPVTDGKKCVMGRGFLQKEERIKIRGMFFDTYVIQPEMLGIEGLFEENQDARFTLWLTSDHTRKPVKIKIEVFIGNIVCELTSPSA